MPALENEERSRRAKPYIAAAVFCERVIREEDGVSSLIRIIDTFTVPQLPPGVAAKPAVQLSAFLMFKSGDATGKYEVRLTLHQPVGAAQQLGDPQYIVLKGGEHGAAIIANLSLAVKEVGLFWIDVLVEGELLTRMPFRVRRGEEP